MRFFIFQEIFHENCLELSIEMASPGIFFTGNRYLLISPRSLPLATRGEGSEFCEQASLSKHTST